MAPIRDGFYLLVESVFADLPDDAWVLCVGVGTGTELAHLAQRFPRWHTSVIESGGFEPPVQFFQAGLLHAWFSKRASGSAT